MGMSKITNHPGLQLLRLQNALLLRQQFNERMILQGVASSGLEAAFAQSVGLSASLWSQIKSGRKIGDKCARAMEKSADSAPGWLDIVHSPAEPSEPGVSKTSRIAIEQTQAILDVRSLMDDDDSGLKFLHLCQKAWLRCDKRQQKAFTELLQLSLDTEGTVFWAQAAADMRRHVQIEKMFD